MTNATTLAQALKKARTDLNNHIMPWASSVPSTKSNSRLESICKDFEEVLTSNTLTKEELDVAKNHNLLELMKSSQEFGKELYNVDDMLSSAKIDLNRLDPTDEDDEYSDAELLATSLDSDKDESQEKYEDSLRELSEATYAALEELEVMFGTDEDGDILPPTTNKKPIEVSFETTPFEIKPTNEEQVLIIIMNKDDTVTHKTETIKTELVERVAAGEAVINNAKWVSVMDMSGKLLTNFTNK